MVSAADVLFGNILVFTPHEPAQAVNGDTVGPFGHERQLPLRREVVPVSRQVPDRQFRRGEPQEPAQLDRGPVCGNVGGQAGGVGEISESGVQVTHSQDGIELVHRPGLDVQFHALLGKLLDVLHKEIHAVEPAVLEIIDLRVKIIQVDYHPVIEHPALGANLDIVHGFRIVHPVCTRGLGDGVEAFRVEAARPEPGRHRWRTASGFRRENN